MGLNAKKVKSVASGPQQAPIEEGGYPARIVQIIDLGVQDQRAHKGKVKPPCQQITIVYELLDEFCLDEDGEEMLDKPRWVKETIPFHPLSSDLATSTKRYRVLDPEEKFDGDFTLCVDVPINLVIVNNTKGDKTYNNVGGISPLRPKEAKKAGPLVNPITIFLMDEPDIEVFNKLPDWQQGDIKKAHDYPGSKLQALVEGKAQDDDEPAEGEKPW